jgi:uncharacterized protein YqgC (DUF456 family)
MPSKRSVYSFTIRQMFPFLLDTADSAQALGVVLVVIGIVGVFIPILPGPVLIWAGALAWAIGDGFQRVGWPTLIVMALLMAAAWGSDLFLTSYFTKRSSSSWKTVAGSIVGGILGGILLGEIPIIGSIFGVVIGGVLGVIMVELLRKRQVRPALQASGQYLAGCILGQMVEFLLALLMVLLFVWQATT